jgi:hypothetical protein
MTDATWIGFFAFLFGLGLCAWIVVRVEDWLRARRARRIMDCVRDWDRSATRGTGVIRGRDLL